MKLLFVHQNFPGQYLHLARHYAALPGHEVVAVGEKANLLCRPQLPGVKLMGYTVEKRDFNPFESSVLKAVQRGGAAAGDDRDAHRKSWIDGSAASQFRRSTRFRRMRRPSCDRTRVCHAVAA